MGHRVRSLIEAGAASAGSAAGKASLSAVPEPEVRSSRDHPVWSPESYEKGRGERDLRSYSTETTHNSVLLEQRGTRTSPIGPSPLLLSHHTSRRRQGGAGTGGRLDPSAGALRPIEVRTGLR